MSEDWQTKYGTRRVRRDPPTLEEAIFAAIGITDDQEQQAEIAARQPSAAHRLTGRAARPGPLMTPRPGAPPARVRLPGWRLPARAEAAGLGL